MTAIGKPLRQAVLPGALEKVMFTSRLQPLTEADAPALGLAPLIIQAEVPKNMMFASLSLALRCSPPPSGLRITKKPKLTGDGVAGLTYDTRPLACPFKWLVNVESWCTV